MSGALVLQMKPKIPTDSFPNNIHSAPVISAQTERQEVLLVTPAPPAVTSHQFRKPWRARDDEHGRLHRHSFQADGGGDFSLP